MEKFSQFRDRGSGVSPFLPIRTPSSPLFFLPRVFLFLLRLVPFVVYAAIYFIVLHHLPLPVAVRKLLLGGMMAIPGIWWVDLQIDGVKRGHLSQQLASRVPHPGSVIAASFTSPIDALYLAAIFDPIFTVSYPGSRKLRQVSLFQAVVQALSCSQLCGPPQLNRSDGQFTDLRALVSAHPDRIIVVFPECGTTNGRGVLPFSPSLVAAPTQARIFPVSMRYTPPDITTPVPGEWPAFMWKLLSRPTHCIRVRIAEGVVNTSCRGTSAGTEGDFEAAQGMIGDRLDRESIDVTVEEQNFLDRVADALSRLGRNKRVGLTLKDKTAFVEAWKRPKQSK